MYICVYIYIYTQVHVGYRVSSDAPTKVHPVAVPRPTTAATRAPVQTCKNLNAYNLSLGFWVRTESLLRRLPQLFSPLFRVEFKSFSFGRGLCIRDVGLPPVKRGRQNVLYAHDAKSTRLVVRMPQLWLGKALYRQKTRKRATPGLLVSLPRTQNSKSEALNPKSPNP